MKRLITFVTAMVITAASVISAHAAEIPFESAPENAIAEQIYIVQNLVGDILDEVEAGNLGYGLASGYANARIREAVIAGQTNGHGYGALSPISQNAIRDARDILLRPDVYAQYEAYLKVLLADIILDVANGRDYAEARKAAYTRIYQSVDPSYIPREMGTDWCYVDVPPVDSAMFTVARKLLLQNR